MLLQQAITSALIADAATLKGRADIQKSHPTGIGAGGKRHVLPASIALIGFEKHPQQYHDWCSTGLAAEAYWQAIADIP